MNEEVLRRLDALAAKLNVTVEHLWAVLVSQARVEVIRYVAMFTFGACCIAFSRRVWKRRDYKDVDVEAEVLTALTFILGCALIVVVLSSIWTPLLNPEFYALNRVLRAIGGVGGR